MYNNDDSYNKNSDAIKLFRPESNINIMAEYLASSSYYHIEYNGVISEQDKRFLISDVKRIFGADVKVNFHEIKKSKNAGF